MTSSGDWQKKHKTLSKELEQAEEYTARLLEQLNSVITQLSYLLQGQDAELDVALKELTGSIDFIEVRQLRSIAGDIQNRVSVLRSNTAQIDTHENSIHHTDNRSAHECNDDLANIAYRLLEVIQLLTLPFDHDHHLNTIILKIESGMSLADLPNILEDIVRLMRGSSSHISEDFEDYLLSLNQQLSYVQTFLSENHSQVLASSQRQTALDKSVRQDVLEINQVVKQSNDILQLKHAVSCQLENIIRSMDEHRATEDTREADLRTRYSELLDKVAHMEKEAERVKYRIEEEQLKARTDSLTGLPNRYAYDRHILNEIQRWQHTQNIFSLCVADLDFFKQVNDEYGHLAGDKVLRLMARILEKNLRETDIVTRFGGEEFVIILPSTDGVKATEIIEKVRKVIESSPFNFQGKRVQITMSFGIAEVRLGDTPEEIFSRADQTLYRAKETGRNKTLFN